MNMKKLIASVRYFFFFSIPMPGKTKRSVLQQSLKDTSELLNHRINESNLLKGELKYLYDILRYSNKCNFRVEINDNARLFLFTTNYEVNKKNVVVYIPREKLEIATVYTHAVDDVLVLGDIVLNFVQCDVQVGKVLLEELIIQAETLGLSLIVGHFIETPNVSFSEQVQFYRQVGFTVTTNAEEGTGSLTYKLNENWD